MAGKFVLKAAGKGKYVFSLKASNGLTVLTSETYSSKYAALNGIESVHQNAGQRSNYELRIAKNGRPYFVLLAQNREVIGQSQRYASANGVKKGIASVQANAAVTAVDDLTIRRN